MFDDSSKPLASGDEKTDSPSCDTPSSCSVEPASDSPSEEIANEVTPSPPRTIAMDATSIPETSESSSAVEGASGTGVSESSEDRSGASEKPSERIRIGSQRAGAGDAPVPKPTTPGPGATTPTPAPSKYPPPNVRAQLSPELEAEVEAALAEESLDALIDQSADAVADVLPPESKIKARVSQIHGDHVFFDLGSHRQGVAPRHQFEDQTPELGTELDLVVLKLNADEEMYELTLPTAAVEVGNWDDVAEGQVVEALISGVNKGGLECQVSGIRGFMPMGQISVYRVETPEDYVGKRLACVVTEANRGKGNLVLSHRSIMERERAENREKLLKELAPGQLREGTVRSLRDFGAFVDLGGVDGLIHVSKMSWERVNHPSEVLKEGQAVKVRVERIDPETGKIGLSYRDAGENPWTDVDSKYPTGARVTGTVSKIMDFGAFVKLEAGIEGLIHISELAHGRVFRTSDAVSEGQQVEVKVLNVDREKQRIGLSLKALLAKPEKPGEKRPNDEDIALPADAPKVPKAKAKNLKGGIGGPSGGEQFGLKW